MFGSRINVQHIYHYYEDPPCKGCGYRSNTGYYDHEGFLIHMIHLINESSVLVNSLVKNEKKSKKKKDKQ